jgi:hypothetical protein
MTSRVLLSALTALLATLAFSTGALASSESRHYMRTRFVQPAAPPAAGNNL